MIEEISHIDLAFARSFLVSSDWRFVLVKDNQVLFTGSAPGVKPLAQALQHLGDRAAGATLADQVVGRAVALLAAHARLAAVYGQRVSQSAVIELRQRAILLEYGEIVTSILNRAGNGLCPFERRVSAITNPAEAAAILANFDPRGGGGS